MNLEMHILFNHVEYASIFGKNNNFYFWFDMKKIIFFLALSTVLSGTIRSQVSGSAIGLRAGYDAQEISYQQPLGQTIRLELTGGANTLGRNKTGKLCTGICLNGIIQWVNDLSSLSTGLNWYLGLGTVVLDHGSFSHGLYGTGAMGQVGVEYNFNFRWQLSLDYRPGWYWLPGAGNIYRLSWNAPCVGVRYRL